MILILLLPHSHLLSNGAPAQYPYTFPPASMPKRTPLAAIAGGAAAVAAAAVGAHLLTMCANLYMKEPQLRWACCY